MATHLKRRLRESRDQALQNRIDSCYNCKHGRGPPCPLLASRDADNHAKDTRKLVLFSLSTPTRKSAKVQVMKTSSMHLRSKPQSRCSSATDTLVMGLSFFLLCVYSTVGAAQVDESTSTSIPFVDPTTIDPRIPTPSSIIGHEVGEKAVRYDPLMRYLEALAASSDRITMNPYGKTHEGRTMVHLFITSPKNHQRLDQIKAGNGRLADPRKLANAAAGTKLVESHPATAIMAYSIHGDELSSTDAAMQLAYQLVAGTDDQTKSLPCAVRWKLNGAHAHQGFARDR